MPEMPRSKPKRMPPEAATTQERMTKGVIPLPSRAAVDLAGEEEGAVLEVNLGEDKSPAIDGML